MKYTPLNKISETIGGLAMLGGLGTVLYGIIAKDMVYIAGGAALSFAGHNYNHAIPADVHQANEQARIARELKRHNDCLEQEILETSS